jgi:HK97 family phage major capsid protein
METISEYKNDIKALMKKVGDLKANAIKESRDPSAEERALGETILTQIEDLRKTVAFLQRTEDIETQLNESDTVIHRQAIQSVDSITGGEDQRDKDNFASAGEFFQAVVQAGSPRGYVDPRLSTRAATGLNETVPSDGGFLVQKDMASGLLTNMWSTGEILPRISKTTLSGNKNGMKFNGLDETSRVDGSRAGGIRAYWAAEAAEKTASKPKFRQIDLGLNKLIGLCYATDELLDDASALEQAITEGFRQEFDFKITDSVINGPGGGQPLGILNSGCVVSVGKETGQAADTLVYENVSKMWSRMIASSRPNAVWVINQDCEPQLNKMSIAVGTGGVPVYMPAGGASVSPYSTLFGRPVVPIEQCQTIGTTGDIMLCDFSQYKAIDKGGMQQDVSIHVRFIYDEQVFRFVYRFDGQPVLSQPITPFKGTNTLSHFVKLDSRD